MKIEVCVDSLESALIAIEAGADQVELVSLTSVGGVTPSYGLTEALLKRGIKTMAMVRPRAAGFCYSKYDREVMLNDVKNFLEMGTHGVVFGALNFDGSIDYDFTNELVKAAGNMEVVFHRAFEVVKDKIKSAKMLKDIGVDRILTKGGNSLTDGKEIIAELLNSDAPEIISGGVRFNTIEIIKKLGLKYVHISSNKEIKDPSTSGSGIYFGQKNDPSDEIYTVADLEYLTNIINKLRGD